MNEHEISRMAGKRLAKQIYNTFKEGYSYWEDHDQALFKDDSRQSVCLYEESNESRESNTFYLLPAGLA